MKTTLMRTFAVAGLTGLCLNAIAAGEPLKVFILAGQSNMQGHAHTRTFDAIGLDPETAPMLTEMRHADGTPRVCEKVWISSIGNAAEEQIGRLTVGFGAHQGGAKIGPEFTFGIYLQKLLGEPILIIKTAWGGKSLNTDFRPPGAGPYEFNDRQLEGLRKQGKDVEQVKAERAKVTGHSYRLMVEHVHKVLADIKRVVPDYDPRQGYELAGFVWFQGWNDMVDGSTYPNRDKAGKRTREGANAARDKLYAATFTPRELKVLRESTSNFDFHYMGSAKIVARIGKAFAEAMLKLQALT
jgi:hypothetical protein